MPSSSSPDSSGTHIVERMPCMMIECAPENRASIVASPSKDTNAGRVTIAFLIGAACSAVAGILGMWISVRANIRTAAAVSKSLNGGLQMALRGGAASGLTVEDSKGECNLGQHEINFRYRDALGMADDHVFYKLAAKEIAYQHGAAITFMAKLDAREGNSCHIHCSFWEDGTPLFAERAGVYDAYIAGQVAHTHELSYFFAPNVNSYKRYWDAGQFAPSRVDWGLDDRSRSVRVSASGRLELKLPDSIVNPYLSHALIAAAAKAGVTVAGILPRRYVRGSLALKAALDAGRFGPVTLASALIPWWRSQAYYDSAAWRGTYALDGGGALMNQSIHGVDALQWIAGATMPGRRVAGSTVPGHNAGRAPSGAASSQHQQVATMVIVRRRHSLVVV